ncbi:E3 ubiquitin-protein ligase RAD18 isoform X1 [Epinephelus fuscoguttatus]|uniref:E3 ubiquitin-protein ligase RAD18 isoform X1 n=2 Tax=Epinephelus fuscoguttatus TaxID=293821 RepID=UPI0020D17F5E|nr:E3 ubiquitin-protein ligase RAD18 isoform X1 [Epinephelus fuscoguttatus]
MAVQIEADLPPNLSCLKNVDTLLRCPICFDFLNISMMTKCSHNFCSLCIRKFLCYKMQCPVCNTQATEQDLRNNRLLDDLVVNFKDARQQLSKVQFDSPPISPKTPASAVKCKTPRQRGQKCSSSDLSHFFQKKPKTSSTEETQLDGSAAKSVQWGKRQTSSTHNANDTDLHSATAHLPVHVKEEPIDVDEVSIQGLMSVKQEAGVSGSISTAVEMPHSSSPSKDVKPAIKVECPVCSVSVPQNFINKHLDVCLSSGEKKESLRRFSLPAKTSDCILVTSSQCANAGRSLDRMRRPMTKLVYTLLSMQELKRRLKECHLSMQGPRDQLIKRHQEFVQIYNAQCDSLNPKSAEDIAKEVEANEKMRNRLQGKAKPVMVFAKNQSEKEIEEMHSNYRKKHSSDFSRLIAQVRGRMDTTRQARIKQEVTVEGEDAQKPHSADQVPESKSCSVIKVEDTESDEDSSARGIELSSSPTLSDVSISSSISDIFGPEPSRNSQDTDWTPVRKRTTRGDDASSSPVSGKRRRKT